MRVLKNDEGYALLTVLLVMIIFMSMGMTLFAHSYNSTKQNNIVEDNNQSVALAEMGITYYQTAIRNAYVTNKQPVDNQVESQLLSDFNNKKARPEGYYGDLAISLMFEAILRHLNTVSSTKSMDNQPGASFSIVDLSVEKVAEGINITYSSKGVEGDQKAMLGAELKIPIKGLETSRNPGSGSGGSGGFYALPDFNKIPYPENVSLSCKNPLSLSVNCSSILIENSKSYTGNYNGLSGKLIYANNSLSVSGNGNNMDDVRIHTNGDFSLGKNMNNLSNSILEIKKTGNFGSQLRVDHAEIYTGENLNINGHLDLENSSVYIGGKATINKHLTIDANSKMCVAGDLAASKIDIAGQLYIKGTIKGKITGTPAYVNTQQFTTACGSPTQSTQPALTMEWGNIINNVKYTY
ncbi:hypothetical protein J7I80_20940 [Bacillus sp. ISL-41]|uniref:hypothetical protein n=1 Tax=Bacillus sp. ISL-41 TaxID=2819127 RepID=UPI001BEC24F6|nr:hypothetical protein [Bacillus sp. ISL-41]MBT2644688.1 hypothetical protein [Bacillus sp. ISL-41]